MTLWDKLVDEEVGMPTTSSTSRSRDQGSLGSPLYGGQSTSMQPEERLEEEKLLRRRQEQPGWRIDRGAGFYQDERMKHKRASLVETGRHAGRSRVKWEGIEWGILIKHILKRDFFNFAVNAKLYLILLALLFAYTMTITFWAYIYYFTWRFHPNCFLGFNGLVSAFLFSVETQQTIGYGARAPNDCWMAACLIAMHSLVGVLMESIILGIAFARISHPKNRGRTILISDCAVITRRDGILKFMFRVADIQKSKVVSPRIQAFLYIWGDGRTTAEGEHIPVLAHTLRIDNWDCSLLLPATVEHTIDERSPLFGLTQKTLEALGAEIIIEFEGSTDLGDKFMVRQSYLVHELHWGHVFSPIIRKASPEETQHTVDLARFHDVEPQPGLEALPPSKLSAKVVSASSRCVPPPVLQENTLALSDEGVVGYRDGRLYLMFRVGDTYPAGQLEDVKVEAFLYRWTERVTLEGETLQYSVEKLLLHPRTPTLRYPVILTHEICDSSPVAGWTSPMGKRLDADCEIVVTVKGILTSRQQLVTRTRVYPVLGSIKWGATFVPIVTRLAVAGNAQVDWSLFHNSIPTDASYQTRVAALKQQSLSRAPSGNNLHQQLFQPVAQRSLPPADQMTNHDSTKSAKSDAAPVPAAVSAHSSLDKNKTQVGSDGCSQERSSDHPFKTATTTSARSTATAGRSAHFGTMSGESWRETRSLFAAISAMKDFEEQQQQGLHQQQ